jgi:hypothetical protein
MRKAIVSLMVVSATAGFVAGTARAATEPRYDTFRSRLSGNVVRIPSRCWAEDSMGHLYVRDIADHGAKYTFGCHHKGY